MKITAILLGLCIALGASGQDKSWTVVNKDLPLDESFEAGSRVVMVIDYENHTTVDYINESASAVTVVFNVSNEGTPLPDDKIGPVQYRTKTLDPGETVQMTFAWEKGHEVSFEISGGALHLRAGPKKGASNPQ